MLEKTKVSITQMMTAISTSMPNILKNISYLSQLMRRSIPTIRRTDAINMIGDEAFEAAKALTAETKPDSSCTGAEFLAVVFLVPFEREDLVEVLFFAPLEEPCERDLVFAIISRYSLSL